MKVQCRTFFDITATGVTGNYKSSRIPFVDRAGNHVTGEPEWNRSRNQQRNWETLTQLMQLRSQIFNLSLPVTVDKYWQFEFEVEIDQLFLLDDDEFGIVKQDCDGVPMITGLNEQHFLNTVLEVDGPQQNIWFSLAA